MLPQTFLSHAFLLFGVLLLGFKPVHSLLSNHQDSHAVFDPSLHKLFKRDLYSDWNAVRTQNPGNFVPTSGVKRFPIAFGSSQSFATSQFYGCTVFVAVGKTGVIIGHLREEMASGCPLNTKAGTQNILINEIEDQIIDLDGLSNDCDAWGRYAIIFGSTVPTASGNGVPWFEQWMVSEGIPAQNIYYKHYIGGGGTIDSVPSPDVYGKLLVQWVSIPDAQGNPNGGTLTVWVMAEIPRLTLQYNADGTLLTPVLMAGPWNPVTIPPDNSDSD